MKLYSKKDKKYVRTFKFTGKRFYYDIETTGNTPKGGLDHEHAYPFFIGFGDDEKNDYALSLKKDERTGTTAVLKKLGAIFANEKIIKVNQNIWFDNWFLAKEFQFQFNGTIIDTIPLVRLLCISGIIKREPYNYKLGTLVSHFLGRESEQKNTINEFFNNQTNGLLDSPYKTKGTDFGYEQTTLGGVSEFIKVKKSKDKRNAPARDYAKVPTEQMIEYVLSDIDDPRDLFHYLRKLIPDDLVDAVKLEMEVAPWIYKIKNQGFKIDRPFLQKYRVELMIEMRDLEKKIHKKTGKQFNIMSDQQLGDIIFGKLGFTASTYTDKGKPKVDKYALEKIKHPIVDMIKKFRKLQKSRLAFVNTLLEKADDKDIVRAWFKQMGASTGRMSSSQPNLQNIPKREAEGENMKIRQGFIPRKGFTLVSFDYSQIEYRLFAWYLENQKLIDGLNAGADYHTLTAKLFNVPRARAKTINFMLIYGGGDQKLADTLGVSLGEAKELRAKYFQQLPEYQTLLQQVESAIYRRGYIKTFVGRRRPIPTDKAYIGLNSTIQGSAGDVFKKAVIGVSKYLVKNKCKSHIINMVHDDILLETAFDEIHIISDIKEIMEHVVDIGIPITVSVQHGNNWKDMTEGIPKNKKRKVNKSEKIKSKKAKSKKSKNAKR